jgi:hypothetical protein
LLSYQGSTNVAYVFGGGPTTETPAGSGIRAGGTSVRKNNLGDEVSGLDRRVLLVDEQSDNTLSTAAIRTSRGLVELYKNNVIAYLMESLRVKSQFSTTRMSTRAATA